MTSAVEDRVRFELGRYPVIVLRLPSSLSVEAVDAWHDEVIRLLDSANERVALVHDGRALDILAVSAPVRKRIGERSRAALNPERGARIAADARVLSSPTGAGLITVLGWLMGALPWPTQSFTDEAEALAWVEQKLQPHA